MNRYQQIPFIAADDNLPRRYVNIKYPEISRESDDIYIQATQGDRYDTLANIFYENSSLWWIIATTNQDTTYDSLIPPLGVQIRIPSPSRVGEIMGEFESLNDSIRVASDNEGISRTTNGRGAPGTGVTGGGY